MEKFFLNLLILLSVTGSIYCTIYDQQNNPQVWQGLCQDGTKQTPINIIPSKTTFLKRIQLSLVYINYDLPIKNFQLLNDGKALEAVLPPNNNVNPSVIFNLELYRLIQFHFHWNQSEHAINGNLYDGEIHLVHQNPSSKKLLVVGALLKKIPSSNNIISNLFRIGAQSLTNYNSNTDYNFNASLTQLLEGVNLRKFYNYEGSLTTPNCAEGVTWIVLQELIDVDSQAIENLKLLKDKNNEPLLFTNRQLQPLGDRKVYRSFQK